ncbi:TPA: hypothetical protein VHJ26_001767, partial [Streptococcus pyogenes]|nr:hypothetical protein [Streptococcus pyogenes]
MVAALSSSILFSKVDLAKAKENLEVNSTKIDDKAKIEIIKKEIAQMEKELSEKINKRERLLKEKSEISDKLSKENERL